MKTVVALDLCLGSDQFVLNLSHKTSRRRVNVHNKFLAALSMDQKYAESGPDSARIAGFQAAAGLALSSDIVQDTKLPKCMVREALHVRATTVLALSSFSCGALVEFEFIDCDLIKTGHAHYGRSRVRQALSRKSRPQKPDTMGTTGLRPWHQSYLPIH